MTKKSIAEFGRFGVVGVVGFAVDGAALYGFMSLGIGPFIARALSFPFAVCCTWLLNRLWTFQRADRANPLAQAGTYFAVQTCGALMNYIVYATTLSIVDVSKINALFALGVGSIAGMGINFLGAKYLAFKAA